MATFTYAHKGHATDDTDDTSASVQLASVAAGSLIVVFAKWEGAATTVSLSDGTTALTPATQVNHSNGDVNSQFFYLLSSVATGTVTYTGTWTASRPFKQLIAWEYTHSGTTATFDTEASNAPAGGGITVTSTNITTNGSVSDGVAFGGYGEYSAATLSVHAINGVGATQTETVDAGTCASWALTYTAPFTGAATATASSDVLWTAQIVAFKATSAAAPFVTQIGAQAIPRGQPNYTALCSFVLGTALTLTQITGTPFAQTAWPLPVRARSAPITALTHTQARPPYYQDIKPFAQSGWALPRLPTTLLSVTIATRPPTDTVVVAPTVPFAQTQWAPPLAVPSLAIGRLTHTQARPQFYTDLKPFGQTSWPPGRALPAPTGLTTLTQGPGQGPLGLPVPVAPVGRALLTVPLARPPLPPALLQWVVFQQQLDLPLTTGTPQAQLDWPIPLRIRADLFTRLFYTSYLVVDETPPIKGRTDPNPGRRLTPLGLLTWLQAKPTFLIPLVVPTGRPNDWPVPARQRPLDTQTWTQSLVTTTLALPVAAPFVPLAWRLPTGRPPSIGLRTWTQNLIASTVAPAGWGVLVAGQRNHLVREMT